MAKQKTKQPTATGDMKERLKQKIMKVMADSRPAPPQQTITPPTADYKNAQLPSGAAQSIPDLAALERYNQMYYTPTGEEMYDASDRRRQAKKNAGIVENLPIAGAKMAAAAQRRANEQEDARWDQHNSQFIPASKLNQYETANRYYENEVFDFIHAPDYGEEGWIDRPENQLLDLSKTPKKTSQNKPRRPY
jgi:hypothetical protein